MTSRAPNYVYDIQELQPHLHRLFEDAKQLYLDRFASEDLGYVYVQLYREINDFFVAFGTKTGLDELAQQKSTRTGQHVTRLRAIALEAMPGHPTESQVAVVGDGREQLFTPEFPDYPLSVEWIQVAPLWRIIHRDGTTTDWFDLDEAPAPEADRFASVPEAVESPIPVLEESAHQNLGTFISNDIYELLETADYSGLETAGQIVLAYGDLVRLIDARHRNLSM